MNEYVEFGYELKVAEEINGLHNHKNKNKD
jgi:hypothetical protein